MPSLAPTAKFAVSSPRLFFSSADLPRLRRLYADDPRFAPMRRQMEEYDCAAEHKFLRDEVDVTEPLHHFRRVHDYAQERAFVFLMTGDNAAAELALEAVRTMMRFEVWDFFMEEYSRLPVGNQRASSGIIALACAIDWLGDRVSAAERNVWVEVMKERGCRLCATSLRRFANPLTAEPWTVNPATATAKDQKRWAFPNDGQRRVEITAETNLRAAPAGALAIGVAFLTQLGHQDAEIDEWAGLAADSIKVFNRLYLPDGSYGEGVNYTNYTSESLCMAIEALCRAGWPDLRAGINWTGHVGFMLNMAMPTRDNPYDVVNTGDAGTHRDPSMFLHPAGRPDSRSALPFWVAREYRDGSAQWFGEHLGAAHNLWSLIFFDDTVAAVEPEHRAQSWHSDLHWMVARTGYRADDLVVNLRSGIGWNHEHADRNNLIIKAHGEPLVVDPLRPPYHFADPAWILRTTQGHSAVLVDGRGHFYHNGIEGTNSTIAQARIVRTGEDPSHCFWISDATQAYRLVDVNIQAVIRAVVIFYKTNVVLVVDRVTKWKESSKVEARFFADNWDGDCALKTDADGFEIRRPGAFAFAKVYSRQAIAISKGLLPIPEERAVKNPFVSVEAEPAMATTLVTAIGIGATGEKPADIKFEASDHEISVSVSTTQGTVSCRIKDDSAVPGIFPAT